jgi:nucleotide-binding universal stress UspA family protein
MQIGWKRLACPVDFSEESRAAFKVAVDLCRRFDASLTLLHVDEHGAADRELAAWKKDAEGLGVKSVEVAHTKGNPQTAIAEWLNGSGADLAVMGTHGRTGRAHALVGSTAESTVRRARCPVMVVHADWGGLPR